LPENAVVVENHTRCQDDAELRSTLLRSSEFGTFYEQFRAGATPPPAPAGGPPTLEDAIAALYWILGRRPRSNTEIQSLQSAQSPEALRMALLSGDDFRQVYEGATQRG